MNRVFGSIENYVKLNIYTYGVPDAGAKVLELTPDENAMIRLCNGNAACQTSLATLMTQIANTADRGFYAQENDKCHVWIDGLIAKHYPKYDGDKVDHITLEGGIKLEFLHRETVDKAGLVTSRSITNYVTGGFLGVAIRMTDHSVGRVTFPNNRVVYFDLGSSTNQGNFGGDDHFWFRWPVELQRAGGPRVPGNYD
jgi:hypothetical protein